MASRNREIKHAQISKFESVEYRLCHKSVPWFPKEWLVFSQ